MKWNCPGVRTVNLRWGFSLLMSEIFLHSGAGAAGALSECSWAARVGPPKVSEARRITAARMKGPPLRLGLRFRFWMVASEEDIPGGNNTYKEGARHMMIRAQHY